jgi:hypothetical protein
LRTAEPRRARGEWRLQKPSVPAAIRVPFARACLTCAAVWAVGALFLSVVPSYAGDLLDTGNLALLGAVSATMLTMACLAQAFSLHGAITPRRAQPAGLGLLIVGIAALVVAFPLHALLPVLAAAVLAGTGLGFAYFGAQTEINQLAPDERRGEVTAAFISSVYLAVSVTAIGTGLLTDATSLSTAVATTATTVAIVAAATAAWHLASARRDAAQARVTRL